jgi:hypothetical protein
VLYVSKEWDLERFCTEHMKWFGANVNAIQSQVYVSWYASRRAVWVSRSESKHFKRIVRKEGEENVLCEILMFSRRWRFKSRDFLGYNTV